ncbi:MAG: YajQ family cyclic di-GMP-binding protein [Rhodospirillaceae bacterium]
MPTFDVVSKTDVNEVENALDGVRREVAQRFDFKGAKCSIDRTENIVTILADDELKLKQMHELLRVHLTRRKLDVGALEFGRVEKAAGNSVRQEVTVRQGVDKDMAKQIVKAVKDSKLKVQVAIQGDELRVTAKKIDDLQAAIRLIRELKIEQPLQYLNFRD